MIQATDADESNQMALSKSILSEYRRLQTRSWGVPKSREEGRGPLLER